MDYWFIERAVDENNEPMLYAEYWGYDDKQTPEDETDDEHLYFIRRNDLRLLSLGDRIASCIVELGYLSNQQDRQQLLSSQYRHKQCGAIHIGCDDYN